MRCFPHCAIYTLSVLIVEYLRVCGASTLTAPCYREDGGGKTAQPVAALQALASLHTAARSQTTKVPYDCSKCCRTVGRQVVWKKVGARLGGCTLPLGERAAPKGAAVTERQRWRVETSSLRARFTGGVHRRLEI